MAGRKTNRNRSAEMMSRAEKAEYAELLEYMALGDFEKRKSRMIAAETRLGMWENGQYVGKGLPDILHKGRFKPDTLTRDEFVVARFGFFPEDAAAQMRMYRDNYERRDCFIQVSK